MLSLCGQISVCLISVEGCQFAPSLWKDVVCSISVERSVCSISVEGSVCQISVEECQFSQSLWKDVSLLNLCRRMSVCSISVEGCQFLKLCGRMLVFLIAVKGCQFAQSLSQDESGTITVSGHKPEQTMLP